MTLFDVFVVLFWTCATVSLVALLVASLVPRRRREGLFAAAFLLMVAGAPSLDWDLAVGRCRLLRLRRKLDTHGVAVWRRPLRTPRAG